MTVLFVICATVDRQISAARDVDRLINQTDSPEWAMGKTRSEALSIGINSNRWSAAALHRNDIRSVTGGRLHWIVGIESRDELNNVCLD